MKFSPVIIVVAYNRPQSLARILSSLKESKKAHGAKLIISIDNKEPDNYNVLEIAENFEWPFGEKEVIYQKTNLGLRNHILRCGDLALKYGSVIILEDDLFVSPYFYDYAVKALEYYDNDPYIGGISLYHHVDEDMTEMPFLPLSDDSDVYFIQFPSSWGQAWSASQWQKFRNWYSDSPDISKIRISPQVLSWRESSWKKYFNAYLVDQQKYFVFPRVSLTTNFNDKGTHKVLDVNHNGQSPLRISDVNYRFINLSDSYCVYDAHFELTPKSVLRFRPELGKWPFELDLYGIKDLSQIPTPYIISTRRIKTPVATFKRALKPHEMNVLLNLPGDEIYLGPVENVLPVDKSYEKIHADFKYFYDNHLSGMKLEIYRHLLKNRFLSKLLPTWKS